MPMATAQTRLMAKTLILGAGGFISLASVGGLFHFHPSAGLWVLGIMVGFLIVLYAEHC